MGAPPRAPASEREAFAARLTEAVRDSGRSQAALARALGLATPSTVSHWCTGARTPNVIDVPQLARELGCDPTWLAFGTTTEEQP